MSHDETLQPDARESFRRFPAWTQPLVTFISGKPLHDSKPIFWLSPVQTVVIDCAKYATGIAGSAIVLTAGGGWLLLLAFFWILTVNAARSIASDAHYGGHTALTMNKRVDHVLGNLLSLSVLSANMEDYAETHNRDHHGKVGIWSLDDPDISMISLMGFELGRSQSYYRWRQLLTVISPRYHLLSIYFRLRTTFITAPVWRMCVAIISAAVITALTIWSGRWDILVFAWLLPVLPGFAISSAFQFPSEHQWLEPKREGEKHLEYVFRVSWGRFFLISAPEPKQSFISTLLDWGCWAFKMSPMILQRSFICAVTLPAHDYHHRIARHKDWPMGLYLREWDKANHIVQYQDFYGLGKPTELVFETWSELPSSLMPKPKTMLSLLESLLRFTPAAEKIGVTND